MKFKSVNPRSDLVAGNLIGRNKKLDFAKPSHISEKVFFEVVLLPGDLISLKIKQSAGIDQPIIFRAVKV